MLEEVIDPKTKGLQSWPMEESPRLTSVFSTYYITSPPIGFDISHLLVVVAAQRQETQKMGGTQKKVRVETGQGEEASIWETGK